MKATRPDTSPCLARSLGALGKSADLVRSEGSCQQQMTHCPLVELWKEEGCTAEELKLLCDIAMEGDYGRAENNGLNLEIADTIARGGERCRLILTDAGS